MKQQKTIVVFRRFKEGDIIALMPYELGTNDPYTCGSYMHIGQHGSADPLIMQSTKPAAPEQYADLKAELIGMGYDLIVRQRFSHSHALAARRQELKRLND